MDSSCPAGVFFITYVYLEQETAKTSTLLWSSHKNESKINISHKNKEN